MLERIEKTGDIKRIPPNRLRELAAEIRRYMVGVVSETGGHLASNLGVVELTIALHRVYDLPKDKIIWDVGHQVYTHKILTGRKEELKTMRKLGGISGFPRRRESDCDSFDTGHSSTSISAGLGYVKARDLAGEDYHVVTVIGDGALTGGMAFEALNNAARINSNYVIVLNDNEMSISRNVGGISDYLDRVRTSQAYTELKMSVSQGLEKLPGIGVNMVNAIRKTKGSIKQFVIPGMLFEDMGLTYLGPIDGHNIAQMEIALNEARQFPGPILVHVLTEKGKGYAPASKNPIKFHGVSAFKNGKEMENKQTANTFTAAFSESIVNLARENKKIAALTAAMKDGTGLRRFESLFPDRFFDVGIAEEHAVTFAAGLALGGMKPVFAVYSSFLQRGFDQVMMDVCMQDLPVVFAIDRAGFVGEDGKTHQGCFDISYLTMLPNMTVMAPFNDTMLDAMLRMAVELNAPAAIRYSKGAIRQIPGYEPSALCYGKADVVLPGRDLMIWAVGNLTAVAYDVCMELKEQGIDATLVDPRFIKPFDSELLKELSKSHHTIMTVEENVKAGGFGSQILTYVTEEGIDLNVDICAVRDAFVEHATADQQRQRYGLDKDSLVKRALQHLKKN